MVTVSDENDGVVIPVPLPDVQIFRYEAMDDILTLVVRNPHHAFTVSQLREITGHGGKTVDNAITLLSDLDLIHTRREGKRKLIQVNRERLQASDDRVMQIPQDEFRSPVQALLTELQEEIEQLVGVVLFGSVARGEADRASDIDVLVIAEGDTVQIRRAVHDVRQRVEDQRFDGDRYEFEVMAESVESATNYGEKLYSLLAEGIVLYHTAQLDKLKEVVFSGR